MLLVGMYGISVPTYLFSGEDNSFWYSVAFPVVLSVYVVAVYLLSTVAVRISELLERGIH
jgi:hypothetical protein